MKKYVALLLILSTLLLAGCVSADPLTTVGAGVGSLPDKQTTAPSLITPPTTTTQPIPTTQPSSSAPVDELAEFNALFGKPGSWYNLVLTCEYATPGHIDLSMLFYNGFTEESREPTDAEWAELKDQPGFNINYNLFRLPVDRMNQVLTDLFGITLEDVDAAGFENLVYLESTNCYYMMHTDALAAENLNAISVETVEDGSIRVYYTANLEDTVYVVTLMPNGDGYRILSNVPAE